MTERSYANWPKKSDKTVWKYKFKPMEESQTFTMPIDTRIIHTDMQDGQLCLWGEHEVDTEQDTVTYTFEIFGTGHKIPNNFKHIATLLHMPPFVWHLYREE